MTRKLTSTGPGGWGLGVSGNRVADVEEAQMWGWFSADAARASCSKRRRRSGSAATPAGSTLIATVRPRRVSRAL